MSQERYINPFTDFGFKKIFGTEANKDLLLDFLNNLFEGKEVIKTLTFRNPENIGMIQSERTAIFDIFCENEQGEKFIIEIQRSKQQFFKERSVYYSTFPIVEQAKKGGWNFDLKAVYLVAILDFVFDKDVDESEKGEYKHEVKLMNTETGEVFYDKLTFIYLEMPNFNKTEDELETDFDKWLYVIKSLPFFQDRPKILKNKIFKKLFKISEIAALRDPEHKHYRNSLKRQLDTHNVIETSRIEGRKEGREEGRKEGRKEGREEGIGIGKEIGQKIHDEKIKKIVQKMKEKGMSFEDIAESVDLPSEEVEDMLVRIEEFA